MSYIAIEQNEATLQSGINLPPQEIAMLYQIAQTGASGSVIGLRDFLGANASIHLNCLSFLPLPIMIERIKMFYPNHLAFHLRFFGEISGELYVLFRDEDVTALIGRIMGQQRRLKLVKRLNRIELSVLAELVNILANSFWRVLTEETSLNWWINPPTHLNDLAKTLTYSAKVYNIDQLLLHLEFLIMFSEIRIQFIMLPSQNTISKIFEKLKPLTVHTNDCSVGGT